MIFTNTFQYAIKSCVILAEKKEKIGIEEISKKIGAPVAFTSKTLQSLAKNGVISSGKGRNGGFYLTEEQYENSTVKDVFKHCGTDATVEGCFLGLDNCSDANPCPIHHIANEIRLNIKKILQLKVKELYKYGNVLKVDKTN
ncbi:MAG: Rrf2 family transcriptional regulator [Flavobacteriales bacterium]|nr:Rrf2 family transcriptional regulator [Flavobacteriales bacterium]